MNDRHPSGSSTPTAPPPDASQGYFPEYVPYEPTGYDTGAYQTLGAAYGDGGDPLLGDPGHDAGSSPYDTGSCDATASGTTAFWPAPGGQFTGIPSRSGPAYQDHPQQHETAQFTAYDYGYPSSSWETGTYEVPGQQSYVPEQSHRPYEAYEEQQPHDPAPDHPDPDSEAQHAEHSAETPAAEHDPEAAHEAAHEAGPEAERAAAVPAPRGNRSRRRRPAKRSALLSVAVPSVCVMGVTAVAAAAVTSSSSTDDTSTKTQATSADTASATLAASKLDQRLESLSADAEDFGDRASRTQERIDLKERQAAEKKKKAADAARKEALRPKFMLPVTQHSLSAYFGQSGVNWMSVHTGIDFPVSYGTEVMAATDGTVRTEWNSAYGNMAIVTAADGTETWYCHLSSTKIRSGSVKAGDVIAYSGNSGNSTGPHLHFEVRPGGGSAIDPLSWFEGHGVDPQ